MQLLRSRYIMTAVLLSIMAFGIAIQEPTAHSRPKTSVTTQRIGGSAAGTSNRAPTLGTRSTWTTSTSAKSTSTTLNSTTSTSATTTSSSVDSQRSQSTPTSALNSTAGPTFGVSLPSLIVQTPATQAAWLANLKSIGITSIRAGADWTWVQGAGPATYDWAQLDQEIDSIRAAGMTVDLVIIGCPPWAAAAGASGPYPQPASPAAFATFAATVAARYAPQGVNDFEIWNEPNNAIFWQPKPNPEAYTADLRAAYASIKAVDSSAFVITGGLAPEPDDGTNINAVTFLNDMYAAGAKGSFDALGYHPYSYPALPNTYEPWSG
jgi:hypothetical protein